MRFEIYLRKPILIQILELMFIEKFRFVFFKLIHLIKKKRTKKLQFATINKEKYRLYAFQFYKLNYIKINL